MTTVWHNSSLYLIASGQIDPVQIWRPGWNAFEIYKYPVVVTNQKYLDLSILTISLLPETFKFEEANFFKYLS